MHNYPSPFFNVPHLPIHTCCGRVPLPAAWAKSLQILASEFALTLIFTLHGGPIAVSLAVKHEKVSLFDGERIPKQKTLSSE